MNWRQAQVGILVVAAIGGQGGIAAERLLCDSYLNLQDMQVKRPRGARSPQSSAVNRQAGG